MKILNLFSKKPELRPRREVLSEVKEKTGIHLTECVPFANPSDLWAMTISMVDGSYMHPSFCSKVRREVIYVTPKAFSLNRYYSVLLHELAHATGHPDREGRTHIVKLVKEIPSVDPVEAQLEAIIEELIAESTAMKLMDEFGLSDKMTRITSDRYLSGYSQEYRAHTTRPPDEERIGRESRKAADYIKENWLSKETFWGSKNSKKAA